MPIKTTTFDFGPIGNKIVALMGFAVAAAALTLSSWTTWRVVSLTHDVWQARHWTVTQASVLHVSMSTAHEPRRLGYYSVRIKYRYAYSNRNYEAGRLVFTGQTGEAVDVWDGQWLARVTEFVESSRLSGRPMPVFVNPSNPADAVVFRDLARGNYVMLSLMMILSSLPLIGVTGIYLPRWRTSGSVRRTKIFIALLFPAIALAGAAIAASV